MLAPSGSVINRANPSGISSEVCSLVRGGRDDPAVLEILLGQLVPEAQEVTEPPVDGGVLLLEVGQVGAGRDGVGHV